MNRDIIFLTAEHFQWLSLALVGSAGIFCLLMEYRKRGKRWIGRSLLLGIALLSLLMVAWRPAYRQILPQQEAILLMPNAPAQAQDSLRRQHPEATVYALKEEGRALAKWLPHISYISEHLPPGSKLFLLGEGLEEQELAFLNNYDIQYFPAPPLQGLQELFFERSLSWSDTFKVNGKVNVREKDTLQAALFLEGKKLDSTLLYRGRHDFQLEDLPSVAGLMDYHLDLISTTGATEEEVPLRTEVAVEEKLTIALLSSFPSFELRHLKNWLARQGHGVYYQTETAPNHWQRELLNLPEKKINGLNKELLWEVDILVTDLTYLAGLSRAEEELVQRQLKTSGMGLLVLTGSKGPVEQLKDFGLPPLRVLDGAKEVSLRLSGGKKFLPSLRFTPLNGRNWSSVAEGPTEEQAVVSAPEGIGTAVISSLENTYTLLLEGEEEEYKRLWNSLLQHLVRPQPPLSQVEADFPAFVGKQHHLELWTTGGEVPVPEVVGPGGRRQFLQPVQDPVIKERWHVYHWPLESGLFTLKLNNKDSLSFNVLPVSSLSAWQQNKSARHIRSKLGKGEPAEGEVVKQNENHSSPEPVSLLLFYLLFLLSMGALWLDKKLSFP